MPMETLLGRRVHWTVSGQGAASVFIHCALADAGAWLGVQAHLNEALRIVAPDLPGHGRTEFDSSVSGQTQAVETAAALAARAKQPVHLVGHSFGATVALRMAVEAPSLVKTLTLIEPVYYAFLADVGDPAYEAYLEASQPFRDSVARGAWEATAKIFLSNWGSVDPEKLPPEHFQALVKLMPLVAETVPAIVDRCPSQRITIDALDKVDAPVQLIRGGETNRVIAPIHEAIQARLPGTEDHVIAGAGHLSPLTHPEEVARLIGAFIGADTA